MKAEEVLTGKEYKCKSKLLKESFTGNVLTKFENSCIVKITKVSSIDEDIARELQNKIVVSYKDIKNLKANKEIA